MIALLDVNILVALAWPNHVHHEAAHGWFDAERRHGWATCPVSESGFVRLSSNPTAVGEAKTPAEAIALLQRVCRLSGHVFWADDVALSRSPLVAKTKLVAYRQVTDAHLLAIALRHRGRLATADAGVRGLVPDGFQADQVVALVSG